MVYFGFPPNKSFFIQRCVEFFAIIEFGSKKRIKFGLEIHFLYEFFVLSSDPFAFMFGIN